MSRKPVLYKVEYGKLKEVHKGLKKDHDELREKCAKLLVDNSQRNTSTSEMKNIIQMFRYIGMAQV